MLAAWEKLLANLRNTHLYTRRFIFKGFFPRLFDYDLFVFLGAVLFFFFVNNLLSNPRISSFLIAPITRRNGFFARTLRYRIPSVLLFSLDDCEVLL